IPVAIFGALFFVAAGPLPTAGLRAREGVRGGVPGFLFAVSTAGLAGVLYLGYASFFINNAVCILCLAPYAAVFGRFLPSCAATSFPMTTLPRRAVRDVRVLVSSPLALTFLILFIAGAATTLAFFPREAVSASGERVAPAPTQDQTSEFLRWYSAQPRIPLII